MRPRILTPALALLPALVQAAPARVQAPDAPWLTFATAHYRIHCPAAFEAFGRDVAGRVEGVHAQYLGLVGFAYEKPGKPIDIVILDPVLEANGLAFPILQRPQVVLWKTEPAPDSPIGHHRGWAELLVAHELGHMHHLLRPARRPNLWQRWTAVLGPLAEKSPRWVTEGYATLIEGKLTGSGRPHSAIRAAVLRQWALEGKLPTYEALSGTRGFLGGSLAYLGGSGYLEWLEAKAGDPKVLQTLWLRLAGKRDFEAAFRATFGFGPKDGYQRYCAELTHTALELERFARAQGLREGELVTQLQGWASDLALSPDGTKLLARVTAPKHPGLYVWDLKAMPKAAQPEPGEPVDHAPAAPVLPPARRLGPVNGALPWKPLWTGPDRIAFQLRLPDAEGVLKPQPWQWTLGRGLTRGSAPAPEVARPATPGGPTWREVEGIWNLVDGQGRPLTRTLAAAWNPVATPDGRWIYYTQLSASGLQIRRLDATRPPLDAKPLPQDPAPLVPGQVLPKADESSPLPPPVPVEPHPYRVGESHDTFTLAGYSATPSGLSAQLGAGGNDLLNRLNWQVLAGLGDGAGPRGGMAGVAWRGWRWAPSLQAFSLLERPSSQRFAPLAGFDRERRGAELAFERADLGRPRAHFRPVAAFERVAPADASPIHRALWGVDAGLGSFWSRDGQGLRAALASREQQGRTDGHAWTLTRTTLTLGWINPWSPLTVHLEEGRIGGDPTTLDRFRLGGVGTSLLPTALDANRVVQAALPAYTATGNRLRRLRGDLGLGLLRAYVEHATVWQDAAPRPSAQRVAGLELDSRDIDLPLDVLRRLAGNLSFTVGLHRPLDGTMKGRTVGTLSVIVRP
ncbi:hypothetical protein [Geothrix edaphica]|uniref:Uncharacterized protein n=1 Tax=Geothrix edaphica TaxID=2927976 RepID=A0ABQ5Q1A2_9BACT|nr:hypothetical protein [Geothrix edaphica]GLH68439.1 hypothetical protein GETHED_28030 [Geothrix edaphica]